MIPNPDTATMIELKEKLLADIETEGEKIHGLADVLNREKNKMDRAARDASLVYERALKNHRELTPEQIEQIVSVREAREKADRMATECASKIADLEEQLRRCRSIKEKYSNCE
jgi:ferritin-like metal-binding protein YciE